MRNKFDNESEFRAYLGGLNAKGSQFQVDNQLLKDRSVWGITEGNRTMIYEFSLVDGAQI